VHSGAASSIAEHPIGRLHTLGFAVTVNTDNRLMSGCTASSEWNAVVEAFGWTWDDVATITERAVDAAFLNDAERTVLRRRVGRGLPVP
jgi:adenosine deaminase